MTERAPIAERGDKALPTLIGKGKKTLNTYRGSMAITSEKKQGFFGQSLTSNIGVGTEPT